MSAISDGAHDEGVRDRVGDRPSDPEAGIRLDPVGACAPRGPHRFAADVLGTVAA